MHGACVSARARRSGTRQPAKVGLFAAKTGIGQEVIRYLEPFGVRIIAVTRDGRDIPGADLNMPVSRTADVWPQADYPVIIAPATPQTGMVGKAAFEAMPAIPYGTCRMC